MLYKSEVLTQGSGSIGGVTYSHNRAGMYRRARTIPVNPNTGNQVEVRAAFSDQVTRWTEVITPAQRAAWDLYGVNVPVTNALGDAVTLSGQNWYIASNTPRLQAATKLGPGQGAAQRDIAPVIFDRGTFTTPSFVADVSAGIIVTFTELDEWTSQVGAQMYIYQSRPQNPSINYYNGPWRLVGQVVGGDTPAPISPITILPAAVATLGYPFAVGQRIWLAVSVSQSDARLSTRRIVGPEIAIA